jgi:DNA-binding SARP family transcriptional activator/pimeloyl-ACP methyl ester carboxylesterase
VRVSLLGSLQVEDGEGPIALGAAKERSLVAALALSPGSVVSTDSLITALWGDDPPAAARKTLQTYVWNLRQALGADVITTEPPGYVLQIETDDVDLVRFRALVRDGEAAMRAGDATTASERLREALGQWRGDPFAGVASHTGLAAEAVRLQEERLSALDARVAADLAAGRHADIVGELEVLVHDHPYRERLWGYLMTALYRCGRQADALAAYQRARDLLTSELGLEPGGELQRIEAAILRQNPSLAAPTPSPGDPARTIIRSPVRYARSSGGVSVAYEVAGSGPIDILVIPGFIHHLDLWWNAPTDGLVRALTSLGRLIAFDKRGMGLSDRPESIGVDDWIDDALAVLDATGSERPIVLGSSGGSITALRLVERYPERVRGLILWAGVARHLPGPDYDLGYPPELVDPFIEEFEAGWGTGVHLGFFAPSRAHDPAARAYFARYQQLSAGPAAAMRFFRVLLEEDVRDALPNIAVPTLLVHAEREQPVPLAQAQYVADRIPGAQLVTVDSDVHLMCLSDAIDQMSVEMDAFIRRITAEQTLADAEPTLVTFMAIRTSSAHRRALEELVTAGGGKLQLPGSAAVFDAPGRALRCAASIAEHVAAAGGDAAIGLHTAECFATEGGYRGDAVDVAVELAAAAAPGEVLVTRTVRDLVASRELALEPRGAVGRADGVEVFALVAPTPAAT